MRKAILLIRHHGEPDVQALLMDVVEAKAKLAEALTKAPEHPDIAEIELHFIDGNSLQRRQRFNESKTPPKIVPKSAGLGPKK